jgi:hypothetical protein
MKLQVKPEHAVPLVCVKGTEKGVIRFGGAAQPGMAGHFPEVRVDRCLEGSNLIGSGVSGGQHIVFDVKIGVRLRTFAEGEENLLGDAMVHDRVVFQNLEEGPGSHFLIHAGEGRDFYSGAAKFVPKLPANCKGAIALHPNEPVRGGARGGPELEADDFLDE